MSFVRFTHLLTSRGFQGCSLLNPPNCWVLRPSKLRFYQKTLLGSFVSIARVTVSPLSNSRMPAGWYVAESLTAPQKFLQDYTIDGIQDICRELEVDWKRVIIGL